MTEPLTEEVLAKIERIWDAATPRPWWSEETPMNLWVRGGDGHVVGYFAVRENRDAITAAPTHVQWLLAEVKRLRREVEVDHNAVRQVAADVRREDGARIAELEAEVEQLTPVINGWKMRAVKAEAEVKRLKDVVDDLVYLRSQGMK